MKLRQAPFDKVLLVRNFIFSPWLLQIKLIRVDWRYLLLSRFTVSTRLIVFLFSRFYTIYAIYTDIYESVAIEW